MAHMIPALIDEDAPPGERALFAALMSAEGTENWTVLHSLRLVDHPTQQRGEIDFVVVAPDIGIVVIEVKSHLSIARKPNGEWLLGRDRPTTRSPFQQADDAKFALEKFLSTRVGLTATHIESCVWFTHAPVRRDLRASIEWAPWQVLDMYTLQGDVAEAVTSVAAAGRTHRTEAGHRWPSVVGPDAATANRVVSALKPKISVNATDADVRAARDSELVRLLDEQVELLESLSGNPRVLITGPPGCGKTFIGLEAARLEAKKGGRGRLLCFNHALAAHLSEQAADIEGLEVDTLPAYMLELAGITAPSTERGSDFWERTVPERAWEALADGDTVAVNYLIVDEAQDLCRDAWLDVMDLVVEGGLDGGRCLFLADFDDQAIYDSDGQSSLRERTGPLMTFQLRTNCRNVPEIAAEAGKFAGDESAYRRVRRSACGEVPQLHVFTDEQEQQSLLVEAVCALRKEGFALHEIVILSRHRNSAASSCTDPWIAPLLVDARRGGEPSKGHIRYSTIHSFKGLESPAVILTDITESSRGPYRDLLTVGMTRARDRLVVLATQAGLRQLQPC